MMAPTDYPPIPTPTDKKSFIALNMPFILAFVVTLIWGGTTIYIIMAYFKLLGATKEGIDMSAIMAMWGSLTGLESMILSYYFGSSQGSADKQKTIDKMTTPTPTPGVETTNVKTDVIADPLKP